MLTSPLIRQIDVVLLTKNSEHLLNACLTSVYQNIPVNNLIVIDGYSTDHTLDILDRFNSRFGNVKIVHMKGSRAKARTEGIRHVSTEWFMFVDSDVLLCKEWFKNAKLDLAADVGAVWGLNVDVLPNVTNKLVLGLQMFVARQCFHMRGGMHDTLIRRDAVEGLVIPEHLHTFEDAYIINYIERHGFRIAVATSVYCLHYKPPQSWSLENGLEQAVCDLKCGLVYSHLYRYSFFYPVFLLYWTLQLPLNGFRNGRKL